MTIGPSAPTGAHTVRLRQGNHVRHRSLPLLAAVLAMALLAASCGDDGGGSAEASDQALATNLPESGEPTPGGELVIGIEAETDGWDPSQNQIANAGYMVASAIYDHEARLASYAILAEAHGGLAAQAPTARSAA